MPCPQRMARMRGWSLRSNQRVVAGPNTFSDFPDSNPAKPTIDVLADPRRQVAIPGPLQLLAGSSDCTAQRTAFLDSSLPARRAESAGTTTSLPAVRVADSEFHW